MVNLVLLAKIAGGLLLLGGLVAFVLLYHPQSVVDPEAAPFEQAMRQYVNAAQSNDRAALEAAAKQLEATPLLRPAHAAAKLAALADIRARLAPPATQSAPTPVNVSLKTENSCRELNFFQGHYIIIFGFMCLFGVSLIVQIAYHIKWMANVGRD